MFLKDTKCYFGFFIEFQIKNLKIYFNIKKIKTLCGKIGNYLCIEKNIYGI